MAIPSRQIGWGTEDNLLWQISKQLEQLTNVTAQACTTTTTTTTLPLYKVYTALLTQNGGDSPVLVMDLPLVPGITYEITNNDGGTADFTNVGAPNNTVGTFFSATGTTPTSWGDNLLGELQYNAAAPTAIVLENTLGNISFIFSSDGDYVVNSDNLFVSQKTFGIIGTGFENIANNNVTGLVYVGTTQLFLQTGLISTVPVVLANDILLNTPIEIRVYN